MPPSSSSHGGARRASGSKLIHYFIAAICLLVVSGVAYFHRGALLRRGGGARELSLPSMGTPATAESGVAAGPPLEPEDVPRTGCGLPSVDVPSASAKCAAAQAADFAANAESFVGNAGQDRLMGGIFTRFDGKFIFPRGRPINFVQVGAHGTQIIDRYRDLSRGPRLDDVIVLVDANKEATKRIAGRIRLDPRLLMKHAAVYNLDGQAWFKYEKSPNYAGNSGTVELTLPEPLGKETEGELVQTVTLDTLLKKVTGPIDFLMSDADGHEPWIFRGAVETLKRTRLVIFSCNKKWNAVPGLGLLDAVKNVFEPAGMTVALIGEKRNVIISGGLAPANFEQNLPAWGFCVAAHTAPPMTRKVDDLTRYLVGVDEAEDPCFQTVQGLFASSCSGGLIDTLAGVDTPIKPQEYQMCGRRRCDRRLLKNTHCTLTPPFSIRPSHATQQALLLNLRRRDGGRLFSSHGDFSFQFEIRI